MKFMNTNGEWKWQQRGESLVLEGANGFRVLSIERGVIPMNSDARLIAESPALLFELERVVSWFEQYQEAQRSGGNLLETLSNVDLSDAKAAIAKAKWQCRDNESAPQPSFKLRLLDVSEVKEALEKSKGVA